MALLNSSVDSDVVKLLGRWHSDAMIQHLHQDADSVAKHLAVQMFNDGVCGFATTDAVPVFAAADNNDD